MVIKNVNRSQAILRYIILIEWIDAKWTDAKWVKKNTNEKFFELHTTFMFGSSDCPQKALNLPVLTFFF